MVTTVRAEAVLTAQNKLKPGLASAAAELSRFRAMQTKATAAFGSTGARVAAVASQRMASARAAMASHVAMAGRTQALTLGGPAALAASYKQYADIDRRLTRVGVTANASEQDLAGVRKEIEGIAYETAQSSGKVTGGLEALVAQGRSLKEGLQFLPSVARTAAATGAEVADIAKSADAVATNFKIAGGEMQKAFDIMSETGKAGQFELPDMAQYIPSLAPAAAAVGFTGTKGLTELLSILQIMRKGSGSSSDAYTSLNNILMKMDSDETRKNFKKFGIDSSKALEQTRKSGGNVIETFEKLIATATKGDDAKIGEIVKDAEFKRGVLALRAYSGEWQKMAGTVSKTATGSVGRDLVRVTNDARAQIDRMFSAVENRAVQLGGFLAKVVLPLDEAVKNIERGGNPIFNRVEEYARHHNADAIASAEMRGEPIRDYGADTRRLIDARKEYLTRERIEQERGRLGSTITSLEAERNSITGRASAEAAGKVMPVSVAALHAARTKAQTDPLDAKLSAERLSLAELNTLVAGVEELNLKLAETQAARSEISKPSMGLSAVTTDVAALAEAGRNAGRAFREALNSEIDLAGSEAAPKIARLKALLSFTATPSVKINGGLGGFDTGKQGPN